MANSILPQGGDSRQLSLWDVQLDQRIRCITVDGVPLFSVLDVFEHYGKAKNPTSSWRTTLKHLEAQGFDRSREILERTPESGGRPTPYVSFRAFLRIAQVAEFREWEDIRRWMAEVAHERLEETIHPELGIQRARERAIERYRRDGLDERWIDTRLKSIDFRNFFTAALKQHVEGANFAAATDAVYVGILEMTAQQLRRALGLEARASIRDALAWQALMYIGLAEGTVADALEMFGAVIGWDDACSIIRETCEVIGRQAREMEALTRRSLVTGHPLLKGGAS